MKPGEEPDGCAFVVGYTHPECIPLCDRIRAYGDRRGEEERAKALEAAARLMDQKAIANIGGESMCEGEQGRWFGKLTLMAEKWADAIRSLAAAPSGDAKGTRDG